jgi:hypothetical protein
MAAWQMFSWLLVVVRLPITTTLQKFDDSCPPPMTLSSVLLLWSSSTTAAAATAASMTPPRPTVALLSPTILFDDVFAALALVASCDDSTFLSRISLQLDLNKRRKKVFFFLPVNPAVFALSSWPMHLNLCCLELCKEEHLSFFLSFVVRWSVVSCVHSTSIFALVSSFFSLCSHRVTETCALVSWDFVEPCPPNCGPAAYCSLEFNGRVVGFFVSYPGMIGDLVPKLYRKVRKQCLKSGYPGKLLDKARLYGYIDDSKQPFESLIGRRSMFP